MVADLILTNAKAYINGEIIECSLAATEGKILKIGKDTNMPKADTRTDLKGLLVLPGLIDAHVHLRDEGKAYKEDFFSGTAAAAAGGMATVLDMPNNRPVTMSVETLNDRMKTAQSRILINVGFYSEFPQNIKEIESIVRSGVVGFKLFMAEQVGGLNIDDDHALMKAFSVLSRLKTLVAVHAEDKATLQEAERELKRTGHNDIEAYLEAHSETVEEKTIKRILAIVRKTKTRTHFCHVSTRKGLEAITEANKMRLPVTCETTPHNLLLSSDDMKRIGTLAVTMPPVRGKAQIEALWRGVKNHSIDSIGSDHAPHAPEEKHAESVWEVKVGIPGLETTLPLLLTEVKRGRLAIADIVRLMAEKPAEIFELQGRGCIREGNCADLTVVDLKRKYKIDASRFHSKAKYSPFDGWSVEGKAVKTFVNGQLVMDEGEIVAEPGNGEVIRRR